MNIILQYLFLYLIILYYVELSYYSTEKLYNGNSLYKSCNCGENVKELDLCRNPANYLKKHCWKYSCSFSPDAISRLETQLKHIVKGQDRAINTIISYISAHIHSFNSIYTKSPLVLHFAGDYGVGKTLTASIISTYLFSYHITKDPVDHYSTTLFSGSNYLPGISNESLQNIRISELREKMFRQLKKCANSIFIINDLQKMDSTVFSKLEDFFEGTAYNEKGRPVSTRKATFILTSDLSSSDSTKNLTEEKILLEIKKRFLLYINYNRKLSSLVSHVPFSYLGYDSLIEIIKNKLSTMSTCSRLFDCISFDTDVVRYLTYYWENSLVVRKMNGRAFDKYLYPIYIQSLISNIKELQPKSGYKRVLELKVVKNKNKNNDNNNTHILETNQKYLKDDNINNKDL